MDATEPSVCRKAAARCRKLALSSSTPREWIHLAVEWEWLAEAGEGSSLHRLEGVIAESVLNPTLRIVPKPC
jgi:hypothetical protein